VSALVDAASRALTEAVAKGGVVAPPLLVIGGMLACVLGARALTLTRGYVRALVRAHLAAAGRDPAARAFAQTLVEDTLHQGAVVVRTLVVIAPLLGLLGTVSGMIETFDALATMTFAAAGNGGVAGGISEALVSTELGLLVAIPGLLVGRLLDRAERARQDEVQALVAASTGGA